MDDEPHKVVFVVLKKQRLPLMICPLKLVDNFNY